MSSIISVRHLTKMFGEVLAVDNLNLEVGRGQFAALLGPSGCGKTTTLRLLAGFEQSNDGEIKIGGHLVSGGRVFVPPENRKVGMVFQSYALFPHLTVAKNIAYGLSKRAGRADRVKEVLHLVHLPDLGERMPHELSGGQQQRVALARALAPQPDLLLLDEPFSNLDLSLRAALRAEVRQILREAQATAIFVTHDQEEALSLCDQVAVMLQGRIRQIDAPPAVYQQPISKDVAEFLGEANFLPGTAQGRTVTCELGHLGTFKPVVGSVEVMLRPEDLRPHLNEQGSALIMEREYFGRDQVLTCRLNSGLSVRSRLLGSEYTFQLGQRVDFHLPKRGMVYRA